MATFPSPPLSQQSSPANYWQGKRGREDPPHELAMGMCATGHWSVMQSCPPIIAPICISCSLSPCLTQPQDPNFFLPIRPRELQRGKKQVQYIFSRLASLLGSDLPKKTWDTSSEGGREHGEPFLLGGMKPGPRSTPISSHSCPSIDLLSTSRREEERDGSEEKGAGQRKSGAPEPDNIPLKDEKAP